jgi:hypothetical protein
MSNPSMPASPNSAELTPTEYELAVLERFRTYWPRPHFVVKHNVKLLGSKTKSRRQIDIAVFEVGKSKPFLIGEAKRYSRRIDAGKAGSTIALVQDVGGIPAVMVATSGFSLAAENHLASEGIESLIITIKEAQGLRWIPLVEQKFVPDGAFREQTGHLVEALRHGDIGPLLDNDLPYEEWLAVVTCGQSLFPTSTANVLKTVAQKHFDDGVRFNAVMLLDEAGELNSEDIERLLSLEHDPEILDLLREV